MTAAAKPPRARLRDGRQTLLTVLTAIVVLALVAGTVASIVDAYTP